MRYVVTFAVLFLSCSFVVMADDAQTNPLAKKLKAKLEKKIARHFDDYQGYCDVMIEMEHRGKTAVIRRVSGTGDAAVCQVVKSSLKLGSKHRYQFPEKYIRLHISS
ncbi:hypothetical protein [Vibrio sp. CAU 1672]|uniref:hypothetical protein n=1 Tax=Vibrio sp. CAU 1672 TaxID=3032594 RepID=UPI0023DAA09F|nr:hypothetical protein [Vibrio sp. CAU 1672]MDF2152152.1 hypothetical protein [Vibrio sp. CAU 1672]